MVKKNSGLEFKTIADNTVGGIRQKTIQVYKADRKSHIKLHQVESLLDDLTSKGIDKNKIIIRGMAERWSTLKGLRNDGIVYDEEYYNNVKSPDKFSEFIQLQITVYS